MAFDHLLIEIDGPLLHVTINRPEKRNALSRAVLDEIYEAFTSHAENKAVRAVVLTGAGDRSFAAGGDLNDLSSVRSIEATTAMSRDARRALNAVSQFPVPVIAALNGDALGGGAELAVACDFIVAARTSRIGFIQGKLNISTAWGGGTWLSQRVGSVRALRLLSRAELLAADEAAGIGLVDHVSVENQTLGEALEEFYQPILVQAPQVLRAFKALTRAHANGQAVDTLEAVETQHIIETWTHDDHWAAAENVLRKRRN
ncbi:enoyl-CoA hydratase/isomerase family protein (plasmid) [Marinobacter sp. M3C]|jgi:enoyl-CoA hydratase|uniref:enoyl-CoA hydratase/isomerase family protein n=1 Tax=Marinobacter sp. M3C TaxID=2917715 RepID=UPI00200BD1C6|nr:enoyl-CoA hydratase/isomerase family protein [Marinobacter sp. M3C]UQG62642.1 enoyl-CoA hydratase/isomerase family protein [Marinobacter sp. M3C]